MYVGVADLVMVMMVAYVPPSTHLILVTTTTTTTTTTATTTTTTTAHACNTAGFGQSRRADDLPYQERSKALLPQSAVRGVGDGCR